MYARNYLFLLGLILLPAAARAAEPTVEMVGGAATVRVLREGKTLQLKKGDALHVGDELTTDRNVAVDIRLDDKSLIRVGQNSSYRLEEDSAVKKYLHRLLSGVVRVLVPKQDKVSEVRFRLRTPEGTIGVRGTEFVVIRNGERTSLKGLEGEVLFGPADADYAQTENFAHVKKGYQSAVAKGGAPAAPTSYDLEAYLKELKGPQSPFAPLAFRERGAGLKARSAVAAAGKASAPAKPAPKTLAKLLEAAPAEPAPAPSASPELLLFAAAQNGDAEGAKKALAAGAPVNAADRAHAAATPLHLAVFNNHYEVAEVLLGAGANVNAVDVDGNTPLMLLASETADEKMANLLFSAKADRKRKDKYGNTAEMLSRQAALDAGEKEPERRMKFEQMAELLDD